MRLDRLYVLLSAALITFSVTSCKKQTLHFNDVVKLDSHGTDRYNAIYFKGNDGFVVGGNRFDNTSILVSHDAGATWEKKDFPEAGKALYGVTETPGGNIVACGYDGKMLTTTDNGYNWRFSQISNWQSYKDLAFLDDNHAIGISGNSFNSGGISYFDTYGAVDHWDSTDVEYNDIEMRDAYTGYIAGYGTMLKTTDGGKNWNVLNVVNDDFSGISILNAAEMWICGSNGSIFHSTDAGASWNKQRNGNSLTEKKYYLHDILFIDQSNGWAVGDKGVVIYSSDGGKSWKEYEHFTDDALRSICQLPDGNLVVCGDNGALYKLVR